MPDIHVSDETFDALGELAEGGRTEPIVAEAVENLLMQRLLASTLVELAEAVEPEKEYPRVFVKDRKPRLDVGGHQSYPLDESSPKQALGVLKRLTFRPGADARFLRDAITRIAAAFEWELTD